MNVYMVRRTAVIVTLAGFLYLPASLRAEDFRASGSDMVTFAKGNRGAGIFAGVAEPGGEFTGTWSGKFKGYTISGTETWDFGEGDTLTWSFEIRYSNKNLISTGTYLLLEGTGRFAGASGRADYFRIGNGDLTGEFSLEGTLSLP